MSSKTKTTAPKEVARPALLPKLRFPDFRGDKGWENKLIGPYLEDCSGRVPPDTELPVYSSTRDGLKRQDAYFDGSVLQNKNEYGMVPPGCLVYRHMSDDGLFKFNINETGGEIAVSKEYPVFSTKGLNSAFLLAKLNDGLDFKHFALSQKAGGTRTRLYFSRLCEWRTSVPSPAEQQKIAECLSSVDELMAAQVRKVNALKTHKKGVMQQLFPRECDAQPRLRFPEFHNVGEWEVKKLNQLLFETKTRNRALELGPEDVLSVSGEYGCINQIEHLGRSYAGVSVKDYHVVERGDIVYTKSPLKRNPFGIVKENKGKRGIVSTLYAVYRPFPKCCASYLDHFFSVAYNLNSYLQPIVKKGAKNDMKVNNADVLKGEICVPEFQEQRKIADCLSSMDAEIAAETQKLEALMIHKKGLIQRLFPSPEVLDA